MLFWNRRELEKWISTTKYFSVYIVVLKVSISDYSAIYAHENKICPVVNPSNNNNRLLLLTPADHHGGSQET